jgi:hypothetical protein
MEAHEQLRLLRGRLPTEMLEAAAAELARMAATAGWKNVPGDETFDEVVAGVLRTGSMGEQIERAWALLRARVTDDAIQASLDALSSRIAVGAVTEGELSAAVFAYADGSYLIVADHGLMVLTWLAAQLAAVLCDDSRFGLRADIPRIAVADAVAALRLGVARPAVGARAGLVPALTLPEERLALAGALVMEIDLFLIAHELAHVLLGHFRAERRALGAVAGSAILSDNAIHAEHAADLLALTFLLDDLEAREVSVAVAALRLGAVRILFALIELYEQACFVLQPSSHPPAALRFDHLQKMALEGWFGGNLGKLLAPFAALPEGLASEPDPLFHAVERVDRGLDAFLDRNLWDPSVWAEVAQLGYFVFPPLTAARRALLAVAGDDEDRVAELLASVLADPRIAALVAARRGGILTRLELLDHVAEVLSRSSLPSAPVWAVSALVAATMPRLLDWS